MTVSDEQSSGSTTPFGRLKRALRTPGTLVGILLLVFLTIFRVVLAAGVPMAPFMIESYDDALLVN